MDPLTIGAVGAGVAGIASAYAANQSYQAQQQANETNKQIADDNRSYQFMMSNTAYRRSVHDMTLAGLNPILAANNSGASTPSGSLATVQPAVADYSGVTSSALSAYKNSLEAQSIRSQINKTNADAELSKEQKKLVAQNADIAHTNSAVAKAQSYKEINEGKVNDTWYGKYILAPLSATGKSIGGVVSSALGLSNAMSHSRLAAAAAQTSNFKTGGVIGGDI